MEEQRRKPQQSSFFPVKQLVRIRKMIVEENEII
jgi:hypothetical protein